MFLSLSTTTRCRPEPPTNINEPIDTSQKNLARKHWEAFSLQANIEGRVQSRSRLKGLKALKAIFVSREVVCNRFDRYFGESLNFRSLSFSRCWCLCTCWGRFERTSKMVEIIKTTPDFGHNAIHVDYETWHPNWIHFYKRNEGRLRHRNQQVKPLAKQPEFCLYTSTSLSNLIVVWELITPAFNYIEANQKDSSAYFLTTFQLTRSLY